MAFDKKEGDIAVFKNGFKNKETDADYNATVFVNGVEQKYNLWNRVSKKGDPYLGGNLKRQRQDDQQQDDPPMSQAAKDFF